MAYPAFKAAENQSCKKNGQQHSLTISQKYYLQLYFVLNSVWFDKTLPIKYSIQNLFPTFKYRSKSLKWKTIHILIDFLYLHFDWLKIKETKIWIIIYFYNNPLKIIKIQIGISFLVSSGVYYFIFFDFFATCLTDHPYFPSEQHL